jgi:hypothetical protein
MALKHTSLPIVFIVEMITITVATVSCHSANTVADICPFLAQVFHGSIMMITVRQANEGVLEIPTE